MINIINSIIIKKYFCTYQTYIRLYNFVTKLLISLVLKINCDCRMKDVLTSYTHHAKLVLAQINDFAVMNYAKYIPAQWTWR